MFFGIGNKWKNWKPTDEYLSTVSKLDTITKLQELMSKFVYKFDTLKLLLWNVLWDSWKMPDQSLKDMYGDCEDAAILALDILGRRQSWTKPQLLLFFGYYTDSNNKRKLQGHAVTAFKPNAYNNTYSIFSNNEVEHNFTDLLSIGHRFYPLGLKYQEIRDWRGNVLSRKFKLFGTF